jgi:purine nucleosidase
MKQDMHASRVLLNTVMPFVLVPCVPVASHLLVTVAELDKELGGRSRVGTYLTETVRTYEDLQKGWAKVIWDLAATAWVLNPDWVPTRELPSPILLDDRKWKLDPSRHKIWVAEEVRRNEIMGDFYLKATG